MELKKHFVRAGKAAVVLAAAGASVAFADDTATQAAIDATKTQVLTYISLGVAAGFACLAASLAPDVGMSIARKWIKKGAK